MKCAFLSWLVVKILKNKSTKAGTCKAARRIFAFFLLQSSMHGNPPFFMIISYWGLGLGVVALDL